MSHFSGETYERFSDNLYTWGGSLRGNLLFNVLEKAYEKNWKITRKKRVLHLIICANLGFTVSGCRLKLFPPDADASKIPDTPPYYSWVDPDKLGPLVDPVAVILEKITNSYTSFWRDRLKLFRVEKPLVDPSLEQIKTQCIKLRESILTTRTKTPRRIIFHYSGQGAPPPCISRGEACINFFVRHSGHDESPESADESTAGGAAGEKTEQEETNPKNSALNNFEGGVWKAFPVSTVVSSLSIAQTSIDPNLVHHIYVIDCSYAEIVLEGIVGTMKTLKEHYLLEMKEERERGEEKKIEEKEDGGNERSVDFREMCTFGEEEKKRDELLASCLDERSEAWEKGSKGEMGDGDVPLLIFGACGAKEELPLTYKSMSYNNEVNILPSNLFTCALHDPVKISFDIHQIRNMHILSTSLHPSFDVINDYASLSLHPYLNHHQPNSQSFNMDLYKTSLEWILTSITETIAWQIMTPHQFQCMHRGDKGVASLNRNYLLAQRVMSFLNLRTVCYPYFSPCSEHPLWKLWDIAIENQILFLMNSPSNNAFHFNSPFLFDNSKQQDENSVTKYFFDGQLLAFAEWLRSHPHCLQTPTSLHINPPVAPNSPSPNSPSIVVPRTPPPSHRLKHYQDLLHKLPHVNQHTLLDEKVIHAIIRVILDSETNLSSTTILSQLLYPYLHNISSEQEFVRSNILSQLLRNLHGSFVPIPQGASFLSPQLELRILSSRLIRRSLRVIAAETTMHSTLGNVFTPSHSNSTNFPSPSCSLASAAMIRSLSDRSQPIFYLTRDSDGAILTELRLILNKENASSNLLPILLQALLTKRIRKFAARLLVDYVDRGPNAVSEILLVGIFPYLLQLIALRSEWIVQYYFVLVFSKIFSFDKSSIADALDGNVHLVFLSFLKEFPMENLMESGDGEEREEDNEMKKDENTEEKLSSEVSFSFISYCCMCLAFLVRKMSMEQKKQCGDEFIPLIKKLLMHSPSERSITTDALSNYDHLNYKYGDEIVDTVFKPKVPGNLPRTLSNCSIAQNVFDSVSCSALDNSHLPSPLLSSRFPVPIAAPSPSPPTTTDTNFTNGTHFSFAPLTTNTNSPPLYLRSLLLLLSELTNHHTENQETANMYQLPSTLLSLYSQSVCIEVRLFVITAIGSLLSFKDILSPIKGSDILRNLCSQGRAILPHNASTESLYDYYYHMYKQAEINKTIDRISHIGPGKGFRIPSMSNLESVYSKPTSSHIPASMVSPLSHANSPTPEVLAPAGDRPRSLSSLNDYSSGTGLEYEYRTLLQQMPNPTSLLSHINRQEENEVERNNQENSGEPRRQDDRSSLVSSSNIVSSPLYFSTNLSPPLSPLLPNTSPSSASIPTGSLSLEPAPSLPISLPNSLPIVEDIVDIASWLGGNIVPPLPYVSSNSTRKQRHERGKTLDGIEVISKRMGKARRKKNRSLYVPWRIDDDQKGLGELVSESEAEIDSAAKGVNEVSQLYPKSDKMNASSVIHVKPIPRSARQKPFAVDPIDLPPTDDSSPLSSIRNLNYRDHNTAVSDNCQVSENHEKGALQNIINVKLKQGKKEKKEEREMSNYDTSSNIRVVSNNIEILSGVETTYLKTLDDSEITVTHAPIQLLGFNFKAEELRSVASPMPSGRQKRGPNPTTTGLDPLSSDSHSDSSPFGENTGAKSLLQDYVKDVMSGEVQHLDPIREQLSEYSPSDLEKTIAKADDTTQDISPTARRYEEEGTNTVRRITRERSNSLSIELNARGREFSRASPDGEGIASHHSKLLVEQFSQLTSPAVHPHVHKNVMLSPLQTLRVRNTSSSPGAFPHSFADDGEPSFFKSSEAEDSHLLSSNPHFSSFRGFSDVLKTPFLSPPSPPPLKPVIFARTKREDKNAVPWRLQLLNSLACTLLDVLENVNTSCYTPVNDFTLEKDGDISPETLSPSGAGSFLKHNYSLTGELSEKMTGAKNKTFPVEMEQFFLEEKPKILHQFIARNNIPTDYKNTIYVNKSYMETAVTVSYASRSALIGINTQVPPIGVNELSLLVRTEIVAALSSIIPVLVSEYSYIASIVGAVNTLLNPDYGDERRMDEGERKEERREKQEGRDERKEKLSEKKDELLEDEANEVDNTENRKNSAASSLAHSSRKNTVQVVAKNLISSVVSSPHIHPPISPTIYSPASSVPFSPSPDFHQSDMEKKNKTMKGIPGDSFYTKSISVANTHMNKSHASSDSNGGGDSSYSPSPLLSYDPHNYKPNKLLDRVKLNSIPPISNSPLALSHLCSSFLHDSQVHWSVYYLLFSLIKDPSVVVSNAVKRLISPLLHLQTLANNSRNNASPRSPRFCPTELPSEPQQLFFSLAEINMAPSFAISSIPRSISFDWIRLLLTLPNSFCHSMLSIPNLSISTIDMPIDGMNDPGLCEDEGREEKGQEVRARKMGENRELERRDRREERSSLLHSSSANDLLQLSMEKTIKHTQSPLIEIRRGVTSISTMLKDVAHQERKEIQRVIPRTSISIQAPMFPSFLSTQSLPCHINASEPGILLPEAAIHAHKNYSSFVTVLSSFIPSHLSLLLAIALDTVSSRKHPGFHDGKNNRIMEFSPKDVMLRSDQVRPDAMRSVKREMSGDNRQLASLSPPASNLRTPKATAPTIYHTSTTKHNRGVYDEDNVLTDFHLCPSEPRSVIRRPMVTYKESVDSNSHRLVPHWIVSNILMYDVNFLQYLTCPSHFYLYESCELALIVIDGLASLFRPSRIKKDHVKDDEKNKYPPSLSNSGGVPHFHGLAESKVGGNSGGNFNSPIYTSITGNMSNSANGQSGGVLGCRLGCLFSRDNRVEDLVELLTTTIVSIAKRPVSVSIVSKVAANDWLCRVRNAPCLTCLYSRVSNSAIYVQTLPFPCLTPPISTRSHFVRYVSSSMVYPRVKNVGGSGAENQNQERDYAPFLGEKRNSLGNGYDDRNRERDTGMSLESKKRYSRYNVIEDARASTEKKNNTHSETSKSIVNFSPSMYPREHPNIRPYSTISVNSKQKNSYENGYVSVRTVSKAIRKYQGNADQSSVRRSSIGSSSSVFPLNPTVALLDAPQSSPPSALPLDTLSAKQEMLGESSRLSSPQGRTSPRLSSGEGIRSKTTRLGEHQDEKIDTTESSPRQSYPVQPSYLSTYQKLHFLHHKEQEPDNHHFLTDTANETSDELSVTESIIPSFHPTYFQRIYFNDGLTVDKYSSPFVAQKQAECKQCYTLDLQEEAAPDVFKEVANVRIPSPTVSMAIHDTADIVIAGLQAGGLCLTSLSSLSSLSSASLRKQPKLKSIVDTSDKQVISLLPTPLLSFLPNSNDNHRQERQPRTTSVPITSLSSISSHSHLSSYANDTDSKFISLSADGSARVLSLRHSEFALALTRTSDLSASNDVHSSLTHASVQSTALASHYFPLNVVETWNAANVSPTRPHTMSLHEMYSTKEIPNSWNNYFGSLIVASQDESSIGTSLTSLKVWDMDACRNIRTIQSRSKSITAVSHTCHPSVVLIGTDAGSVKIFDIRSPSCLVSSTNTSGTLESVSCVSVALSNPLYMSLYNRYGTGQSVYERNPHSNFTFASVGNAGSVYIYDARYINRPRCYFQLNDSFLNKNDDNEKVVERREKVERIEKQEKGYQYSCHPYHPLISIANSNNGWISCNVKTCEPGLKAYTTKTSIKSSVIHLKSIKWHNSQPIALGLGVWKKSHSNIMNSNSQNIINNRNNNYANNTIINNLNNNVNMNLSNDVNYAALHVFSV